MKLIIKIDENDRWRQAPRGEISFSYHDFFPYECPINSGKDKHPLKPAQKITRVRGNQAGIGTCWYPFSSLFIYLFQLYHPIFFI